MPNYPFSERLGFANEMTLILPNTGPTLIGTLTVVPVILLFKNQSTVSVFVSDNVGSTATITNITQATQAVVTANNTFAIGQLVTITGVVGMTQVNNNTYQIVAVTPTQFTINVNSLAFTPYSSGGSAAGPSSGTTMIANEEIIFDCRANAGIASNMGFSVGTNFYATASAGTGSVRISVLYAK